MKVQNEIYANQKMSTEWGEILCDKEGIAEIKEAAADFFQRILKFKSLEAPKAKEIVKDIKPVKEAKSKVKVESKEEVI